MPLVEKENTCGAAEFFFMVRVKRGMLSHTGVPVVSWVEYTFTMTSEVPDDWNVMVTWLSTSSPGFTSCALE
jgi:hypothetical protein